MEFLSFQKTFNDVIFGKSKADLLRKIAESPNRYIGLFRPTKPKAKIIQNLSQSHEIRFGDAMEIIIEKYLEENFFQILDKKLSYTVDDIKEYLDMDQFFTKNDKYYLIEQKVRDDHDSTKKRGQVENFEKKLDALRRQYQEKSLIGIIYFIDPTIRKNKNYYSNQLVKLTNDYGIETHLFYGQELFEFLDLTIIWSEILVFLKRWKINIPDLPETNFDLNAEDTFEEIKDLSPMIYRKLLGNQEIYNEILLTLFPEKKTLEMLLNYFRTKAEKEFVYNALTEDLQRQLKL